MGIGLHLNEQWGIYWGMGSYIQNVYFTVRERERSSSSKRVQSGRPLQTVIEHRAGYCMLSAAGRVKRLHQAAVHVAIYYNTVHSLQSWFFDWWHKLPNSTLPLSLVASPLMCGVVWCQSGLKTEERFFVVSAPAAHLRLLLSFAVGGLLGDVFLHLLPEAWCHLNKGKKNYPFFNDIYVTSPCLVQITCCWKVNWAISYKMFASLFMYLKTTLFAAFCFSRDFSVVNGVLQKMFFKIFFKNKVWDCEVSMIGIKFTCICRDSCCNLDL